MELTPRFTASKEQGQPGFEIYLALKSIRLWSVSAGYGPKNCFGPKGSRDLIGKMRLNEEKPRLWYLGHYLWPRPWTALHSLWGDGGHMLCYTVKRKEPRAVTQVMRSL